MQLRNIKYRPVNINKRLQRSSDKSKSTQSSIQLLETCFAFLYPSFSCPAIS